ncbi:hypothetical protein PHYBOEH_005586 [Phytophthora boehmeriae]|uniref:Uncharacterized protein n=1 Tax=Phytophthora boehmeriae TaxID=109152 RepID=A0A8T1WQE0_9STRA|nr:hypothetical protein PHYBOEH_005586 [Phytophthora boehmeriae]
MKRSAQTVKRQMRSMATSLALVATLGAMYRRSDIMEGLASWVTGLVFPSGDITLSKLLWLAVGLTLACVHLQDFVCNTIAIVHLWQTSSLRHQLFLVDEYSRRTNAIALLTDKQQRLEVETQQFQGQVAIATTGESIGVQVQGRFTRPVPVNSKLFVALELPVEARDVGVAHGAAQCYYVEEYCVVAAT